MPLDRGAMVGDGDDAGHGQTMVRPLVLTQEEDRLAYALH
jgi:hypothetical protein